MTSNEYCPIVNAMELLSKRWVIIVIHKLLRGPLRFFSEIENSLQISGKILSERLKELEALGFIDRKMYPEVPVRVEYMLTEKGLALEPVIEEIRKWSLQWEDPAGPKHGECRQNAFTDRPATDRASSK